MNITRTSPLSGIERTRDLPITPAQLAAWHSGRLIQDAMPHLSADDREFLITGIDSNEWHQLFGELDD